MARSAQQRRGDRWAAVVVALIGLASCAPVAYAVADRSGPQLRSWAAEIGAQLDPDGTQSLADQMRTGQAAMMVGVWLIGGALALALFALRRVGSARYVVAAEEVRPGRSIALPLSIALWSVLAIATTASVATSLATESPTGPSSNPYADHPWTVLIAPAGVALAASFSWWRHRRRWELGPLLALGVVRIDPSPEPERGGTARGVWAFTMAAAIELGFASARYVQGLVEGESPVFSDAVGDWIISVCFVPAALSAVFVIALAVPSPTRWMVRSAIGRPSSVAALLLIFGGLAGNLAAGEGTGLATACGITMLAGGLLASVTGLGIQDTGPQPWLGLLFLAFVFASSLADVDGSFETPSGVVGWAVTVAIAGFTAYEARQHWRATYRRVRVDAALPDRSP